MIFSGNGAGQRHRQAGDYAGVGSSCDGISMEGYEKSASMISRGTISLSTNQILLAKGHRTHGAGVSAGSSSGHGKDLYPRMGRMVEKRDGRGTQWECGGERHDGFSRIFLKLDNVRRRCP